MELRFSRELTLLPKYVKKAFDGRIFSTTNDTGSG
jgi:hypothetical protein